MGSKTKRKSFVGYFGHTSTDTSGSAQGLLRTTALGAAVAASVKGYARAAVYRVTLTRVGTAQAILRKRRKRKRKAK